MKKLITIALATLGLAVHAQTTNLNPGYYWTNGTALATNIALGTKTFSFSTNGLKGLQWACDSFNKQFNLTTTNRFDLRDMLTYTAWWHAENQWAPQAQAAAEAAAAAKANAVWLKSLINADSITDGQYSFIRTYLSTNAP